MLYASPCHLELRLWKFDGLDCDHHRGMALYGIYMHVSNYTFVMVAYHHALVKIYLLFAISVAKANKLSTYMH